MGDAVTEVWYAMTLSIGLDERSHRGENWDPPIEMNPWLPSAAPAGLGGVILEGRVVTPPVDVRISDEEITLFAEMPGVSPDNIDINVRPRCIEIIGKPPGGEGPDDSEGCNGPGRNGGRRPDTAARPAPGGARARLRGGVLELWLPRNVLLAESFGGRVLVK